MHFNYIFWVVWHVINYIFAQVFLVLITFLITFSHSLRKICYERRKIKICHKCFSTFLIPSAYFLLPSWISTVTFHLHTTCRVFPSTHYWPVQDNLYSPKWSVFTLFAIAQQPNSRDIFINQKKIPLDKQINQ